MTNKYYSIKDGAFVYLPEDFGRSATESENFVTLPNLGVPVSLYGDFHRGYAPIIATGRDGKYVTLINLNGEPQFDLIKIDDNFTLLEYAEGYIVTCINNEYCFIDRNGNITPISFQHESRDGITERVNYLHVSKPINGFVIVSESIHARYSHYSQEYTRFTYVSTNGRVIIPANQGVSFR
jgi:hypothetical protein